MGSLKLQGDREGQETCFVFFPDDHAHDLVDTQWWYVGQLCTVTGDTVDRDENFIEDVVPLTIMAE